MRLPPKNVIYEDYVQAMRSGRLTEHGTRRTLFQEKSLPDNLQNSALAIFNWSVNCMRRAGLLYAEPYRYFKVKEGCYDVIHMHAMHARFLRLPCPLVVSNAIPHAFLYRYARAWSDSRVRFSEAAEGLFARLFRVNQVSCYLPQVHTLICFTDWLAQWYAEKRISTKTKTAVVPIYLDDNQPTQMRRKNAPARIGFVAKDFDAKGGKLLLEAFELVKKTVADAELFIVGSEPQLSADICAARNITWIPFVDRAELLGDMMPSFTVFAYPTQFDGMPLVVLEALSLGIPVIVSDFAAMPEIVGSAGVVTTGDDSQALCQRILELFDARARDQLSQRSQERYASTFSHAAVTPALRRVYEDALAQRTVSSGRTPALHR
jgi:glycosyltransferase involved in cell wall biosynthesis